MEKVIKILKYAMHMEKQGENFYLKYKDDIENERGKRIFENLAKVEREHYNLLKAYYDELSQNKSWDDLNIDLSGGEEIFEAVMNEEKDKIISENIKDNMSDMTIMRMAYLIENDFANFYQKALEETDNDQAKELLDTLAKWENKHRELFYNEFKDSMKDVWFDQNFYPF
ncbi:ferritin family protein [Sporosalibacterium faouarense]|uniref:ferritin family protein n=1 Tax=Sporosalibacterium faouarense TaxID=516123 RepID=UPI00141CBE72|nr:ferritin family protein [Sporosalibacterium faouarense]MTI48282.1 rubrerythrin [Bacillota bacterium]